MKPRPESGLKGICGNLTMRRIVRMLCRIPRIYLDSLYFAMRNARRSSYRRMLEVNPRGWLLDCGCREGANTAELAQIVQAQKVIGLDYNLKALNQASERGIVTLRADLNRGIPLVDSSVDVVIATDVLEHLVDPYTFVGEMYRVLKPGGYILLDTPNLASWHNIFALFIGFQPFSGPNITTMEDADIPIVKQMHRVTHGLDENGEYSNHSEKELTRHIVVVAYASLLKLLRGHGFLIEQVRGFGYYPLPPPIAQLFQRLDPRHAHHIVVKARKPRREGAA